MPLAVISGVAGQDGAFLGALLLRKGYSVVGLVSNRPTDTYRLDFLGITQSITLVNIDLLTQKDVQEFFIKYQPDEFYNLAAVSSVGYSFKEPSITFEFNTRSVMNLLEAIRQFSPDTKFYQASSSEMFGNVGYASLPIKESFLFHPVSPYGISKAAAHWLTVNYREAYKLKTCCGILFNHESALRPDHFVIKKIIYTALDIKEGKTNFLNLGNIAITRDWGYAPLYVDAMWRMLQQEKMDDYLICSGTPISLQGFVHKVFHALDLDAEQHLRLDSNLLRSLDLEIIYGDNAKAKNALGWDYSMTPDDLIKRLIRDEIDFRLWQSKQGKK